MPLSLEEVGLNKDLVELDYQASFGFGRAYRGRAESRSDPTEYLFAAASSFRRAGAGALLLGRRDEMILAFKESERLYSGLHSSEAALMEALRSDRSVSLLDYPESRDLNIDALDEEERAKLVYSLFKLPRYAKLGFKRFDRIETLLRLTRASYFSGSSLGLLGIPINSYLNLCMSLPYYLELSFPRIPLEMSLAPFVIAYDSAIQTASKNLSNWRFLVQKIHPAEPDIIGLLSMIHLALDPAVLPSVLLQLPMSGLCRTLLLSARGAMGRISAWPCV